jgi:putative membrane protein
MENPTTGQAAAGAPPAEDRVRMAMYRTTLALDRTTLAWLRTTLTMATFGFGLVGFFRSVRQANPGPDAVRIHEGAILFGTALIVLGLVATIAAGVMHLRAVRRLSRGELPTVTRWPLSVTVAMIAALAGLVGLFWLFAH